MNTTDGFIVPNGFSWDLPSSLTFRNVTPDIDNDRFHDFLGAYCINPPDNTCYFPGRCPNTDVASILVRVAAYVTAFCLGNFLLFDPVAVEGTFANQMLYVYSLLATTIVAITKKEITRFHAEVVGILVGSPLTFNLLAYSVVGFFRHHRVSSVLGPGRRTIFYRLSVIVAFAALIGGVIFTERGGADSFFPQSACDPRDGGFALAFAILFLPYAAVVVFLIAFAETFSKSPTLIIDPALRPVILILVSPCVVLLVLAAVGLIMKRHSISKRRKSGEIWFWATWTVLAEEYPFVHWAGIHFFPTLYWILVSEGLIADGLIAPQLNHDNHFELSFGGMLAIIVIIQPLYSTAKLMPRVWFWFIDLLWVRILTCRVHHSRKPASLAFDEEKAFRGVEIPVNFSPDQKPMYYTHSTSSSVESISAMKKGYI